jgi:hypothetical protein
VATPCAAPPTVGWPRWSSVSAYGDPESWLRVVAVRVAVSRWRSLRSRETMPDQLRPGALTDRTVLVQGGAGAVGNAAIQLARWTDGTVIATVSSAEKAQFAVAAGATHVLNYREQDVAAEVRKIAPDGSTRSSRSPVAGTPRSTPRSSAATGRSPSTPTTAATNSCCRSGS